MTTEKSNQ